MTAPNLRPSIIQRTDNWPPCYTPRMGLYRDKRPVPWVLAFVVVVGLAIAIRVVA